MAYVFKTNRSVFDFIEAKRSELAINQKFMNYCSVAYNKISSTSYLEIRFQNDDSYIDLEEYSTFYMNYSDIPFKDVLKNNEVLFSSDSSIQRSAKTSQSISNSLVFDRRPSASIVLTILLKKNTYQIKNPDKVITYRRGNQFIRAIMYRIDPNVYRETRCLTTDYIKLKNALYYPERPLIHEFLNKLPKINIYY